VAIRHLETQNINLDHLWIGLPILCNYSLYYTERFSIRVILTQGNKLLDY